MEAIKSLLSSNKKHDEEGIAQSGQTTGTTTNHGGLAGEGSHLGQTQHASAGNTSGTTSGLTGQGSHLAQEKDRLADNTTGLTGHQSSSITGHSETSGEQHLGRDQTTRTGTASGLTGHQSSGVTGHSGTSGEHHLGRDAAVGAGGVGLARREQGKHENQHIPGSFPPANSGLGGNPQITGNYASTTGSHDTSGHHLGRDAAAVGTAGAVGEGIHHREHEQDRGLGGNSGAGYGSSNQTGAIGTAAQGPHTTSTANRLDPTVNSRSTGIEDAHHHSPKHGGGAEAADSHHMGRDAAVGAGGVGLAKHEHDKHQTQHQTGAGTSSNLGQSATGHNTTSSSHHLGRDAAVGAGGIGGAGLAEHEHGKHENERGVGSGATSEIIPPSTTNALPGPAPNTSGPHSKDWLNKLDPRVDSKSQSPAFAGITPESSSHASHAGGPGSGMTTGQQEHHLGRDAAVAGGVGGAAYEGDKHFKHDKDLTASEREAKREHKHELKEEKRENKDHHYGRDAAITGGLGGAAYEAEKHHRKNENSEPSALGQSGQHGLTGHHTTGTTSGHGIAGHPTSDTTAGTGSIPPNIANRADPDYSKDSHFGNPQQGQQEHHLGGDAAIAGGVGGAAYESNKHFKHDKDLTHFEREAKKEHKHELKEEKKKEEKKEHKDSKGGFLSFLHRDKNKKYTAEEEADFDRQEREHNSSHKGRDAALGAGAVGAAGVAGHEQKQHQLHHTGESIDHNKPLPTAPGNHGIGTGAGTQNALAGDNTSGQHHYGRDATLGAGAVGAAGMAGNEHNKQHGATPLAEKPAGTDLGDKLHGVERNRGVPGATSGFPDSNTSHGASAYSQSGQYDNTTSGSGLTGQHQTGQHTGATGYSQGNQYDNPTSGSGLTGQHQAGHHTSSALGSSGLGGEKEYRTHNTTEGITGTHNQAGFAGSNEQSGITGSNTSGVPNVMGGSDGRQRLHKDPPADHPAARMN